MNEVKFDELLEKAIDFHKKGTKWHFHVLMKDCIFNQNNKKLCIILEDENKKEGFV